MYESKFTCDVEKCFKNNYTDFFEIFEICTLATCVILSVDFMTKVRIFSKYFLMKNLISVTDVNDLFFLVYSSDNCEIDSYKPI